LQKDQVVVPSLFLYGHTATGKSLLVDTLLTQLKVSNIEEASQNCGIILFTEWHFTFMTHNCMHMLELLGDLR